VARDTVANGIPIDESGGRVFLIRVRWLTGLILHDMNKAIFLPVLAGAVLLGGCGKQTKINTEEIKVLSQQMVQLQQNQARQMADIQTQLTSLAPMIDRMNNYYFEKTHDDAFFFHTNTLLLMLTVNNKIESELQTAEAERAAESVLAYAYHTNQLDLMQFHATQIQDAMTAQESRIEDNVNAETKRTGSLLSDDLLTQIKLSAPTEADIARQKQLEADVAQIRSDLDQLIGKFGLATNPPAAGH
jgi:hypothetical protein